MTPVRSGSTPGIERSSVCAAAAARTAWYGHCSSGGRSASCMLSLQPEGPLNSCRGQLRLQYGLTDQPGTQPQVSIEIAA